MHNSWPLPPTFICFTVVVKIYFVTLHFACVVEQANKFNIVAWIGVGGGLFSCRRSRIMVKGLKVHTMFLKEHSMQVIGTNVYLIHR